jgi:bisphosphoglycerate-dependent phosphoglycerate mutase
MYTSRLRCAIETAWLVMTELDVPQFEVVYTSRLSCAIETAWLVMNELNVWWLPIIKPWRLNERMCE